MQLVRAARQEFYISGTRFEDLFVVGEIAFDCILGRKFMIPNVLYIYPDADRPVLASIRDHKFYAECVQQNPVHRMMNVNACLVTLEKKPVSDMEDRLFYETSAQEVNINHMVNPDLTPENRKVLCDVISEFSVYLKKTSGRCTISEHIIECDTKIPVAGPPRSVSPQKDVIIHDPVEEMLESKSGRPIQVTLHQPRTPG